MFESRELALLEQRRQELLAKCDLQRLRMSLEIAKLRMSTSWLDTGAGWLQKARPALLVLAPLAGIWLVRKFAGRKSEGSSRLLEQLASGLALYQRVRSVWDQFSQRPPEQP